MNSILIALAKNSFQEYPLDDKTFFVLEESVFKGEILAQVSPKVYMISERLFTENRRYLLNLAKPYVKQDAEASLTYLEKYRIEFIKAIRTRWGFSLTEATWLCNSSFAYYTNEYDGFLPIKSLKKSQTCGLHLTVTVGIYTGQVATVFLSMKETKDFNRYSEPTEILSKLFQFANSENWAQNSGQNFNILSSNNFECPNISAGDIVIMSWPGQNTLLPTMVWSVIDSQNFTQIGGKATRSCT